MLYFPCSSVMAPVISVESWVKTETVTKGIASPCELITLPLIVSADTTVEINNKSPKIIFFITQHLKIWKNITASANKYRM